MKQLFLLGIVGIAVVFGSLYFLWRVVLACYDVFDDWRFAKELRELEAQAAASRREKAAEAALERDSAPKPSTDASPAETP